MKILQILLFVFAVAVSGYCQSGIYLQSIPAFTGGSYALSNCQGKKLIIVVLPDTQTQRDSLLMMRVDSIAAAHAGQLKIIAVPSLEDGYSYSAAVKRLGWYRALLDTSIVISQPVYTHKSSGPIQHDLFNWLTHASQNVHFDYEVAGAGSMFFVSGQGELNGVFGPEGMLSNKVIRLLFQ